MTANPDDLVDIIERLEKLAGPDYALSQEIGKAVGAECRYQSGVSSEPSYPHYTFSIDAALTLVPEGHKWHMDYRPGAQVWITFDIDGDVRAATPAIALCIAALTAKAVLRARASSAPPSADKDMTSTTGD